LSAQSDQQRAKIFRSLSYVGVVISKHGQSRLPAWVTFKASAHQVSTSWMIGSSGSGEGPNGSKAVAAVKR
jgi:hypothetical protein